MFGYNVLGFGAFTSSSLLEGFQIWSMGDNATNGRMSVPGGSVSSPVIMGASDDGAGNIDQPGSTDFNVIGFMHAADKRAGFVYQDGTMAIGGDAGPGDASSAFGFGGQGFPGNTNSPVQVLGGATPRNDHITTDGIEYDNIVNCQGSGDITAWIFDNGKLFTAGKGVDGHLGDNVDRGGNEVESRTPVQISTGITNWANVFGGKGDHVFAITEDGHLYNWGTSIEGIVGNGTQNQNLRVPTRVGTDTDWAKVAMSGEHAVGLKTDGTIYCTGNGGNGATGQGNESNISTWAQVGTDTDWCHITAGTQMCGALKTNGKMYRWGNGNNGRSGNGNNVSASVPTQVGTDTDWYDMAASTVGWVAIKVNGTAYAWGANVQGQLGINNVLDTSVPTQIGSLDTWARTFDCHGTKGFIAKSGRASGVGNTTRLWYDL